MQGTRLRRIHRISTGLFSAIMLVAGVQELRHHPELAACFVRLGYPMYLLTILGIAKMTGATMLLFPRWPRVTEWVYAGFAFDLVVGAISHITVGDTFAQTLPAILCATLLAVSYWAHLRRGASFQRG